MSMQRSGSVIRPEGQSFSVHVDETVSKLLQQARDEGVTPSQIRFVSNVTSLPDHQVVIVAERMKAAGLTTVLIDDTAHPRQGIIRPGDLSPHELALLDQAAAARADAERSA